MWFRETVKNAFVCEFSVTMNSLTYNFFITTIWVTKTLSIRRSFLYRKLGLIFVEHQKMQCFPKIDLTMKWLKKFLMRLWHVKFQCFVHSSLSCQIKHDRWWCYRILNHLTFMIATSKIYFYHQFFSKFDRKNPILASGQTIYLKPHMIPVRSGFLTSIR